MDRIQLKPKKAITSWKDELIYRGRRDPVWWITEVLGDKLWSKQEEICWSVLNNERTACPASYGIGKCVGIDERISLSDGRVVRVGDLIGLQFGVIAFDEITHDQIPTLAWATHNGVKPVFEVITKLGRKIIRTSNHPLYSGSCIKVQNRKHVYDFGFKAVESLKVGDVVLIPKVLNNEGGIRVDDRDAKLVGYLLGDGCTSVGVKFSQKEGKQKQEFIEIVESFGGKCISTGSYDLRIVGAEDTTNRKGFEKGRNPILNKVKDWGMLGKTSKTKSFPDWVWTLPNDQLAMVLNRYFSCDGWAYVNEKSTKRANVRIGITSASEKMIRDVELAMLRFGITGMVRKKDFSGRLFSRRKNKFYEATGTYWNWECYKAKEVERFGSLIGIFGKEKAVNKAVSLSMQRTNFTKTAKWLHEHTTDEFIWDEIKSISFLGDQETVAISVPKYHTYISTVVEHNTFLAARIALWFLYNFKPAKVITTAPCYDDETEILTDKGWCYFKDLTKTEKVASLVDGKMEFVTPTDWLVYPVEGEMLGYKSRDIDFLVTPHHKLYVKPLKCSEYKLVPAHDAFGRWDWRFNRKVEWEGVDTEFSERFYELLGFWFGDGSVFYNESRRAYGVCISQTKYGEYVEELLMENGFKYSKEYKGFYANYLVKDTGSRGYSYVIYSKDVASWFLDNFGRYKVSRRLPDWLRNSPRSKLQAFIKGFLLADGSFQKDSTRVRVYGNKGLADDIQEIGLKAGYIVNCRYQYCGDRPGANIEDSWALNFLKCDIKDKSFPGSKKPYWYHQYYKGNVYCVTVPSGVLLVRRNGIYHWSGNTLRQVRDLLWKELRTAYQKAKIPLGGTLLQMSLTLNDEHFAVGFSTDEQSTDKFTGYHSPNQLVIFDQAAGITTPIWESAEGLMTSENCRWLAISNTALSESELANICIPERKTRFGKWHVIRIRASESPNVVAGRNIYPGLVSYDWVKRREDAWGKDDPLYKIFIEADFVQSSQMSVIPYRYILPAFENEGEMGDTIEVGVDVARQGLDSTVLFARSGSKALEVRRLTGNNTMEVVGEIVRFKKDLEANYNLPVNIIKIDVIGIGAGVYDRCLELDEPLPAVAINNSEKPVVESERYLNLRAELAWTFRRRMELGEVGFKGVIVNDFDIIEYLQQDINSMRYKISSNGRIQLWSKDDLRVLLGRSPDYWDACVMAFETPGGLPSVESVGAILISDRKKVVMSDEEWNAFLGLAVPIDDPSFQLLAM